MFKSRRIVAIVIFISALIIPALLQSEETVEISNLGISVNSPQRVSWDHQLLSDGVYIFTKNDPWFNFWSDESRAGIKLSSIECPKDNCTARELLNLEMDSFVTAEEAQTLSERFMIQQNIKYISITPVARCSTSAALFDLSNFLVTMPGVAIALECDYANYSVVSYGQVRSAELYNATFGLVKSIRWHD